MELFSIALLSRLKTKSVLVGYFGSGLNIALTFTIKSSEMYVK